MRHCPPSNDNILNIYIPCDMICNVFNWCEALLWRSNHVRHKNQILEGYYVVSYNNRFKRFTLYKV